MNNQLKKFQIYKSKIIPANLASGAQICYSKKFIGDHLENLSSDFTVDEMNTAFGTNNHPSANDIQDIKDYKGVPTWTQEPTVINPNKLIYWPNYSNSEKHLHLIDAELRKDGYYFNGSTAYGQYYKSNILPSDSSYSIFVIYKPANLTGVKRSVTAHEEANASTNACGLYLNDNTVRAAFYTSAGAQTNAPDGTIDTVRYFSHALTINGTSRILAHYMDGKQIGASAPLAESIRVGNYITVSSTGSFLNKYELEIKYIGIFNYELSEQQIYYLHRLLML